jgi:hypothetical protein
MPDEGGETPPGMPGKAPETRQDATEAMKRGLGRGDGQDGA